VSGLVAAPNAAAIPPVTTFSELSTAFAAGGTVVLGADITNPGESLDVDAGESVTLDLAGHSLSVTGVPAGDAAVGVPAGAELIVVDAGGSGSITATGGTGGAGIGGGVGADGVSDTIDSPTTQGVNGAAGATGTLTGGNGLPGAGGGPLGQAGGDGGQGGAVAGTAPLATGGERRGRRQRR
jgi:hypothetical protein